MIANFEIQHFQDHGYLISRGLFSPGEVQALIGHYMELRTQPHPNDLFGVDPNSSDPLKKYPRMLQMHRYDEVSLKALLDRRIQEHLTALMGREPFAVQSMIYFKAPGARGQALHQDQYYLRVQPGSCIAAWVALDRCDEENGCLRVVPGSQNWPLLCTTKADTNLSFTDVTVPIPPGTEVRAMEMEPGDVLFFNGQVVHGSTPNRTTDRFRRSLILHYVGGEAIQVAQFYHPALRFDGTVVELDLAQEGGQCGIWVDQEGVPVVEMVGVEGLANRTE